MGCTVENSFDKAVLGPSSINRAENQRRSRTDRKPKNFQREHEVKNNLQGQRP